MQRVNMDLPRELWRRVGIEAAVRDMQKREIVVAALEMYLGEGSTVTAVTDYTGWDIFTGFLGGNLLAADDAGEFDPAKSCQAYSTALEQALREAYPGATVRIEYQVNASGATPATLQTTVTTPDGDTYRPGDPDEGGRIADDVENIGAEVWERYDWAVPSEGETGRE